MTKCTPEFNDETKRLMAHQKDLARVAKGAETGDFGAAIRAKAREVIDAGEANPAKVVDAAHEYINQYAPHSKEEVANAISGYGKEPGPVTRSEAQERLLDVKQQLRDQARERDVAAGKVDPNAAKAKARDTALIKEKAELERQLRENDFPEPTKRTPPNYPESVQQKALEVARLKNRIESQIQRGERLNEGPLKRTLGLVHDLHLFNIFTSLVVHGKLAAAVLGGHTHALLSGATIRMAQMIPQIRRIADLSPDYGAGLNMEGLKARGKGLLEAPKAALQTWLQGASHLEMAHGDVAHSSEAYWAHIGTLREALDTDGKLNRASEVGKVLLSYPARSHGVIKQFLSHPEFFESKANQAAQITRALESAGKKPDEITEFLNRDSTQAAMNTRAIARAYDAKMQGANKWNDALIGAIGRLNKSDNPGAQLAAFLFKTILPVVRVGPNVFKQGTSLIYGGVKAGLEAASKGEMTPERADYIMKNIGAQGSGVLLAALGVVFSKNFGGIPGAEAKKKGVQPDIKPDEAQISGLPVGAAGFHGAPFSMLQMGAGLAHVYQQEMKLPHEEAKDAALYALGSNVKNWAERTLPYTDMVRRTSNTLEYGRNHGKAGTPWGEVIGSQLRSIVMPQGVQQIAKAQDPDKRYPAPRSIGEDIASGLPKTSLNPNFNREKVPHH